MSSSYDYSARQGVLPISWQDFHGLCKGLARAAAAFGPEIILAAGRGGFYPGALIAQMLRVKIYPIRLSRRVGDEVRFGHPRWLLEPPALAAQGISPDPSLLIPASEVVPDKGKTINSQQSTVNC